MLKKWGLEDTTKHSLYLQPAQGEAFMKLPLWNFQVRSGPRAGLSLACLQPPMRPLQRKKNQRFVTHSAAETKQFRCPSFSSRTSLVRASPVDCRPMTIHCGETQGVARQASGPHHRLRGLLPTVPGTSSLHPAPDGCKDRAVLKVQGLEPLLA